MGVIRFTGALFNLKFSPLLGAIAKTLTCSELHKRAEKIAALLQERGKIEPGDHVGKATHTVYNTPRVELEICILYHHLVGFPYG